MKSRWSADEIELAKKLISENLNYVEIGKILNRSRGSVKAKLNQLSIYYFEINKETRRCLNCGKEHIVSKKNEFKFCNSSCSATYNNTKRGKLSNETKNKISLKLTISNEQNQVITNCLCCNMVLKKGKSNKKFCSYKCHHTYKRKIIYSLIESGDISLPNRNYKNYLIDKFGEKCMECGWCERNVKSNTIPIELEHIDGNSENNKLENLKLLCPNCHSLTPTYKALNSGNGRMKRLERYYSDIDRIINNE